MDRFPPPAGPAGALAVLVVASFLLPGCSGKPGRSGRSLSFAPLKFFPASTRVLFGTPSPSVLKTAAAGKVPAGLEKAFWEEAAPGGFGPFSGKVLEAALEAWERLEKRGVGPARAWFGSDLPREDSPGAGILVLDFPGRGRKGFFKGFEEIFSGKKDSPGGWVLSRSPGGVDGTYLLRRGKEEIPLEGFSLGKALVLVFGKKGAGERVRAAWAGKAPSLQGAGWAVRVKESVAEGWPSWARAPGSPGKGALPSLLEKAGLPRPEGVFERWVPGEGENFLELSYGTGSGFPWALGRLSVDPDAFASLLPADTEAFLLGAWNTDWVKKRLIPVLERFGGDMGWLNDLLNQVERILRIWDEGSIPYEMVSKRMLSFGIALRPSKPGEKPDLLLAFGVPQGEESWFLGWLERGYRTQVYPRKQWWGKTNYLVYERKAEPTMAGTTGKGHLFLASSRERLIGWLEAAEGKRARLSDTGAFKALRLSLKDPADLFLYVSPRAPGAVYRLLPGAPRDFGTLGVGPFGGGIFLVKGKLTFLSRWPLSPWNLALEAMLPGK